MRDDFADNAEIWLAGQARPDVSCQVSQLQQTLPQPTVAQVCGSNLVVRFVHQHADLGLKIRRIPVHNMMLLLHVDASLNTERSGWLTGRQCLWFYRQVIAGRMRCSVVSNGLEIIQNESDRAHWAQKHKPCLWLWALSIVQLFFLQELIHGQFDLQGVPAVMQ